MAANAFGRCRRCRRVRQFVCTERFRVNASKKVIDVWLLFRCWRCGALVKVPVLERVHVSRIARADLEAYRDNDSGMASRVQHDVALLSKVGLFVSA